MNKLTLSMSSIFTPFTNVFSTIRPCLFAKAITESALPLSWINCASLKSIWWSLFTRLIRIPRTLRDCFMCFFLSEVFTAAHLFGFEQRNQSSCVVSAPPWLHFDNIFYFTLQLLFVHWAELNLLTIMITVWAVCSSTSAISILFIVVTIISLILHLHLLSIDVDFGYLTILALTVARLAIAHLN